MCVRVCARARAYLRACVRAAGTRRPGVAGGDAEHGDEGAVEAAEVQGGRVLEEGDAQDGI